MTPIDPIYIGPNAIEELIQYVEGKGLNNFTLIADTNTYKALGERVEARLKAEDYTVTSVVLSGEEVIADAHYLLHVLINAPLGPTTFLAVGSGTITDITRFTSHRTGRSFISMPTAPSVDGFTSVGAPLVVGGVKQTLLCQAPIAMFADLQTLCEAPQRLVAAGYGDMVGKIASLADWKLGTLLWDEPFDESIYKRSEAAIAKCLDNTEEIGRRSPEGIRQLMDALVESGFCMLEFGNSRPASGAEHHASHYWEMMLLQQHRPALLHGAKVGFALSMVAKQYGKIRELSSAEVGHRLEAASMPTRDAEIAIIREGYGDMADDVIQEHGAFLDLTPEGFEQVKQRIADNWDAVQEIAKQVPSQEEIADYLRKVGGPADPESLGLTPEEIALGFKYGHYLRNRFTVVKLSRILDVPLM